MPTYPNAIQWSTTNHEQISTVNPLDVPAADGSRLAHFEIMEQTHAFNANFQKELLLEYKRDSKNKSQEYTKFLVDKKALITISFGQCDEATKTEIALREIYDADCQAKKLSVFIEQTRTVCFGSNDGCLSYGPYKKL